MIAPARAAALRILGHVSGGATLADALARERDRLADARDRNLAHDLASGTLRWRNALDHVIAGASARPLDRIDPAVLDVLRLGAYQLLYLERVPDRAIVHDAVELVRTARHASAAGFVNAVLRKLARPGDRPQLPARPSAPDAARREELVEYLATTCSHPRWLCERWLARVGFVAAEAWVVFNNTTPPLTLRINARRTTREALAARLLEEGIRTVPTRWAAHGLIVESGSPLATAAMAQGLFVVQDEASQLVGDLAAAWIGSRALDACAAPGGKALALVDAAAAMAPTAGPLVVAADRRPRRLRLLRETLTRLGASHVPIVQIDLARALPFDGAFDLVLVDAPCSGLGTLRREPDLKWRREPADLVTMAAVQQRMLAAAARAVAPGGVLVYATCSSEPEENDEVAEAFLASHAAFVPAGRPDPARAGRITELLDEDGRLHTRPHEHGLEAFFAAVFRRRG